MAESLPEPPPFERDEPVALTTADTPTAATPAPETETAEPAQAPDPETPVLERDPAWGPTEPAVEAEAAADAEPAAEATAEAPAAEAEAGPAEPAWPAAEVEMTAPTPSSEGDLFSIGVDEPPAGDDPRLTALGLEADFAAAEAEAASFDVASADDGSEEVVPELAEEAIAARLAGIIPEGEAGTDTAASTTLTVTGLVSVASIAGFKRHLSKVAGVRNVGVSSGPDGEFVYLVSHDPGVALRDAVPSLPGFAARVTADADGALTVTAQDPESGN
jgi:hypothetical protein